MTPRQWLTTLEHNDHHRSDAAQATYAVAALLSRNAGPSLRALPGVDNIERVTGLGRRRVFRTLARLRRDGWIARTVIGNSRKHRRSEYMLTVPPEVELPPIPDEEVSPRLPSGSQKPSRARNVAHWSDSPATKWAVKTLCRGWSRRQIRTALEFDPDTGEHYGSPASSRSLWRVLAWRINRYRDPSGNFAGPLALFCEPPRRRTAAELAAEREERAERREEMARPEVREAVEKVKAWARKEVRRARTERAERLATMIPCPAL